MQDIRRWMISLFLLLCIVTPRLYSNSYTIEQEILTLVRQEYPGLQQTPLALFLVSTSNCAGCSAVAINHAITLLHKKAPRLPCIVAIITDTPLEAVTIRERFFTPYVVADTLITHIAYASEHSAMLPHLAVFDSEGQVILRQEDIQHTTPDYTTSISGLLIPSEMGVDTIHTEKTGKHRKSISGTELPALADTSELLLEESEIRSVRDIISPVIVGRNFIGINYLTGQLEQWDINTGKIYTPVKVPDTVSYFYRYTSHDRAWSKIEKDGYEMARFEALSAVGDTLYALVKLLTGYTVDTVMRKSASGVLAPVSIDRWRRGQVVVRMEQGKVTTIIPVSDKYTLLDIIANDYGYIGGICSNSLEVDTSAGDSVAFFVMIDGQNKNSFRTADWKLANTGTIFSAGAQAAASDGMLWYCDPMQSKLWLLHHTGLWNSITMYGTLRESGSPIRLMSQPSDTGEVNISEQFHFSYILDNMIAVDDTLSMLLIPEKPASGLPCLLQSYTTTGVFLGERTLDIATQQALWIHLLAIEDGTATILLNTVDKRWRIRHIAIPHSLPTPTLRSESLR